MDRAAGKEQRRCEVTIVRGQANQCQMLEAMSRADAQFFERHPDRRYRVRLASADEIKVNPLNLPAGWRTYTAVHQVMPGIRLRAFLGAPEGAETGLPEELAAAIFRRAVQG
jgi:hypothetical protein